MMNVFKRTLLAFMFFIPALAFGQKLAHVNTQKILDAMPEVKVANGKLDTLQRQYQAQIQELADEYQKKALAYQNTKFESDALRNTKLQELQQLEQRAQAFQEEANDDFSKKREAMMLPIENKLKDAIKAVAKEGGYTYIFDSTSPSMLYAAETDEVTNLVFKKLGLK